jgi:hypothetical protein
MGVDDLQGDGDVLPQKYTSCLIDTFLVRIICASAKKDGNIQLIQQFSQFLVCRIG